MPEDRIPISDFSYTDSLNNSDNLPVIQEEGGGSYENFRTDIAAVADHMLNNMEFVSDLHTTAKKIIPAINEAAQGGGGGSGVSASVIADEYDPTATYNTGDYCIYNGGLYVCNDDNVTGAWNSAKWTSIQVMSAVSAIPTDAAQLPIQSGSATKTKAYIDSGLGGKVNTTDFDATNLPITSGSATDTKSYIDNIKPQIYNRYDVLINVEGGTLRGFGSAMVTMSGGIARIDFNIKISVDETVSNIGNWGINRDYFTALTGKTITPVAGGVVTYYNNEQVYAIRVDFGGTFIASGQFWRPARVYDDNGTKKVGGWFSHAFATGDRLIGTCYGTYT